MGSKRRQDLFEQLDGLGIEFDMSLEPDNKQPRSSNTPKKPHSQGKQTVPIPATVKAKQELFRKSDSSFSDHIWDSHSDEESNTEYEKESILSAITSATSPNLQKQSRMNIASTAQTSRSNSTNSNRSIFSRNTTSTSGTAVSSHYVFQKKLRIANSTIANLDDMVACLEGMILSENDLIESQLAEFVDTIQNSKPHNTYRIKLHKSKPFKQRVWTGDGP